MPPKNEGQDPVNDNEKNSTSNVPAGVVATTTMTAVSSGTMTSTAPSKSGLCGDTIDQKNGSSDYNGHHVEGKNSIDSDGNVRANIDCHASVEEGNDKDDQSNTSSLSSTPILVLKRMKKIKQQRNNALKTRTTTPSSKNKPSSIKSSKKTPTSSTKVKEKSKNKTNGAKIATKSKLLKSNIMTSDNDATLTTATKTNAAKTPTTPKDENSTTSSSKEEEEAACCLCFCGVDYSDRALFFPKDRKEELDDDDNYYFTMEDPYLDEELYDRNNALVYCDCCNRLYHQKCHFVPLLVVPRGDWNCLICSIQQQQISKSSPTKRNTNKYKNKRNGGISSGKTDIPQLPIHDKIEWKKFLDRKVTVQIFQTPMQSEEIQRNHSPVDNDVKSLQKEFELASAPYKAQLWYKQLNQLRTFLMSQASNIRRTNTALATMTSTKRNRQHFSGQGAKSQELAQTIVHQTGAKFKIRDAFISLETLRIRDEPVDFSPLVSWCQQHPDHAPHVFPFGIDMWQRDRRIIPRTKERAIAHANGQSFDGIITTQTNNKMSEMTVVPTEICVKRTTASTKRGEKKGKHTKMSRASSIAKKNSEKDDDDSGISLDDLQCSVCMIGDSTDENDLILCDGQHCHRAFHMKCVYPALTMKDLENEDEDWFCPLCSGISKLMGEMHDLCIGSEDPDLDEKSIGSWDDVKNIFPGSDWEYQTAMKLLKGKKNSDTQRLLSLYLGEDISDQPEQLPIGSDSEDENNYSLFDELSFEERRRKDRETEEQHDSDVSTRSSQVTLVEISSVEDVGKDELAALAAEAENDSEDENHEVVEGEKDSGEGRVRKSRRLRKKKQVDTTEVDSRSVDNGADFSESNIIQGKRRRNKVDYRKLNDALFGSLDEKQRRQIDDQDDFIVEGQPKKKSKTSDDSEGNSSCSDQDSDNDGNSANEDDSVSVDEGSG